ncbi:SAC3/GANP/Nin1/mts3/eIF-3 p25 family-domain-containing protein [Suillus bovinus]|uniref:SAC3/GANP/Nin1/mts3/eIF-3 p25 family-domain-containing protein n=1 Tax=Suillus bovinus TaxID=48563 RepID=UPI001B8806BC|nr:SAC3/GANP/Nin1/mts3/eIF-3 p25 family-domain-containing protein [Suillus bovinus]KAG2158800.1 SAC3/GANP/Nin1/mts3/eIF-3 p25 family-domain-containing protein [Suillus bovinus]
MASQNLATLYNELQRAFDARPSDLKKCGTLLAQLKVGLIEAGLLIPQGETNLHDLVVARDILEIGVFWSIRVKDVPSFDRYFSQLHTFYTDYRSSLPPSKREFAVRGLNLIRLLTQNRIADFHTTLESLPLPADEINANPYIRHPVNLERWLMEGSYSKVWNAREEAPAEEYKFFVDSLMGTIRNEIASCEESAYDSLPLKDATTLLFFPSQSGLLVFAQQRGWQVDLTAGTITFAKKNDEQVEIPTQKLIAANLAYARELEQIV